VSMEIAGLAAQSIHRFQPNTYYGEVIVNQDLTEKEIGELIRLAKRALWSPLEVRRKIQDQNINIIPANFYSDTPVINDIESSFEYREPNSEVYNSRIFDKGVINDFIDSISVYANEFSPPLDGDRDDPNGYFWNNSLFSFSDAMSYYCVLRHFKPDHILEIGSGFSTLVANEAIKKNQKGRLTLIEPYPKEFLRRLETVDNIIESFVQDIKVSELVKLVESSDIWFIDSTHTVKIGSDCLYIYLKVMPEIAKNIIVHTHDIYLPFAMPMHQALNKHMYWTEQYLLYAYMLDNPKIEVLFGSAHALRILPDAMIKLMLNKYPGGGGSIWYKLNGDPANTSVLT
jgi:hypothetical protein